MLCWFQAYGKVIQLYISVYPFFFFFHVGYYGLLSGVPRAIQ